MYRLIPLAVLLAAACDSKAPAPAPTPVSAPPAVSPAPVTPKALLEAAERERTPEAYQRAVDAVTLTASNSVDAAAADAEVRAIARWRLSLMRGDPDPEVAKALETAG